MLQDDIAFIKGLCSRLSCANLLVLDKEISAFLSAISESPAITTLIMDCNKNYYFSTDWQRFFAQKSFAMPGNKRQIVAFVFGLLYKFDINELSSINTLSSFYAHMNDLQKAYQAFCADVLFPMQDAVIALLKGEPFSDEEMHKDIRPLDKMNEDVAEWTKIILRNVESCDRFFDNRYGEKELTVMLKGLLELLERNQTPLLKPYWNGMKNTFSKYKLEYNEIYEIEKLFKLYGLDTEI
ncbi:MAG: hypothetical protein PHC84_02970 [Clostridia bacterium]|nr:hypothetical protein [Clostridia bacterium]